MKRLSLFVSILIFAVACGSPTETTNSPAPANANMATDARPAAMAMTEAETMAKEKAAWDAIKNKDYTAFADMLASDQIYVSGEAIYDKAGTIEGVKGFEPTDVTFSDWKFVSIDKDAVVITYSAKVTASMNGKAMPPESIRASSAWVNRDGKWLSIYHQDCQVKPPMATPAPKGAKGETPAPGPASMPTASLATGPDPIANEKLIYEVLKAKNYDGFAALLAEDATEVEPDGVFDKAGSVKGVAPFDFSKAVVSDFKAMKLNSDAALVTYVVKIPGAAPKGERHSTIWASRGGKWLAVFHHGSPVLDAPQPPPAMKSATSPATSK